MTNLCHFFFCLSLLMFCIYQTGEQEGSEHGGKIRRYTVFCCWAQVIIYLLWSYYLSRSIDMTTVCLSGLYLITQPKLNRFISRGNFQGVTFTTYKINLTPIINRFPTCNEVQAGTGWTYNSVIICLFFFLFLSFPQLWSAFHFRHPKKKNCVPTAQAKKKEGILI